MLLSYRDSNLHSWDERKKSTCLNDMQMGVVISRISSNGIMCTSKSIVNDIWRNDVDVLWKPVLDNGFCGEESSVQDKC